MVTDMTQENPGSHAPGGGELNEIDANDAHEVDRVVPRPGETAEHDPATHPDEIKPNPDDAGNCPQPL